MPHFTSNNTKQCRNGSSSLLSPAFSEIKRTNHAPISCEDQTQVSQDRTSSCRNKENCHIEVHGGEGLELVKPAREPAFSRSKSCASLKNAPGILSVRRSLLALIGRNRPCSEISLPLRNLPVRAFDSRAQGFSTLLARRRSSCPPLSPNLVITHPIEYVTLRLRMLLRPTRLSATVPPASGVPSTPKGHRVGAWKRRTGWTPSSTNQTAVTFQSTEAYPN